MIRWLADENIPLASAERLRQAGHDVVSVVETMPGASDEAVLQYAVKDHRIIITFDRDYGELIFQRRLPCPAGVVFFRFVPRSPTEAGEYLLDRLKDSTLEFENLFTTCDRAMIRQRPLPGV